MQCNISKSMSLGNKKMKLEKEKNLKLRTKRNAFLVLLETIRAVISKKDSIVALSKKCQILFTRFRNFVLHLHIIIFTKFIVVAKEVPPHTHSCLSKFWILRQAFYFWVSFRLFWDIFNVLGDFLMFWKTF